MPGSEISMKQTTDGRPLPNWRMQQFLREMYETENMTRLRWYVKTKALRAKLMEGEFRMITVLRNQIQGAVPKPGGAYKKVLDMKPKDYRIRILEDPCERQLNETIERLGLFKDPTLTQPMYPVDEDTRLQLYDGVSAEDCGRSAYLKERKEVSPEKKYRFATTSGFQYGWRLTDFIRVSEMKNPEHVRRRVIEETFYARNEIPGLSLRPSAAQPSVEFPAI